MGNERVLTIKKPEIAYEIIDDEVVVINFSNGNYFSLAGTGTDIWRFLVVGATICEISDALLHLTAGEHKNVEMSVSKFCEELEMEGLIAEGLNQENRSIQEIITEISSGKDVSKAFEEPVFQKFSDMQDLVMIDPIHEVDDAGWPAPSKTNTSN